MADINSHIEIGVTTGPIRMKDGFAMPSDAPGLGIDWDWMAIDRLSGTQTVTEAA